jgi:hypothetical protein
MAKLPKAIYAPGELDKVRQKLGDLDKNEAQRMAELLGGEVGWERTHEEESKQRKPKVRNEIVDVHVKGSSSNYSRSQPKHRVELPLEGEDSEKSIKNKLNKMIIDPADDPTIPIKLSYRERVKMDRFAAQPEFEIKNSTQVFYSTISIFAEVPDYVNPDFINRRMKDIYQKIEVLVTSMRTMFPRNNLQRNEKLRKTSKFAISVLDTLRYWNIERISTDLTKIQASPRSTKISDFSDILKSIYKPLFILDKLDAETHIKGTFKLLYKVLSLENAAPGSNTKYQTMLRNALSSYVAIKRDIRYVLYPMLMKLLSDRWMTYEEFFKYRKNRFLNFINASEADQIIPVSQEDMTRNIPDEEPSSDEQTVDEDTQKKQEKEEQRKKAAAEVETKMISRGQHILESLFPRAGWERISLFPDLYPYFHDIFNFPKGYELISPTDPVQQIIVLMRILEELSFGIRYVSFGTAAGPDGTFERLDEIIGKIMNEWHGYIENTFDKLYIPRLVEYCRILDSPGYKPSSYSRRILNEMHLLKKFCFLPHYTFMALAPPTIHKRSVKAIYPAVRTLRRYLTIIANNIEQANKKGGADANVSCNGIDNPWEDYNFPVQNPVSRRIDALLEAKGSGKKNNAALIFFTLSITVVLDYITNNENSWSYKEQSGSLFRSVNGEGQVPLMGVDTVVDADAIFKQSVKQR